MKISYSFLWLIAIVMISSCSQQGDEPSEVIGGILPSGTIGLTEPEMLSIMFGSDNELTEEEADSILSSFMDENPSSRSQQSFKRDSKEVVSTSKSRTRSNETPDHVVFYEYEISNNTSTSGKAIVCGDKRFPSVLAFIDSYQSEVEPSNTMIDLAKCQALKYISQIKLYEDSLRNSTITKIKNHGVPENFSFKDVENSVFLINQESMGGVVTPGGVEMAKIGPLTNTQWNQTSPYNLYAPSTDGTDYYFGYDYNNRYPAGCLVIAMAQVAAYYQPSITGINWSLANVKSVSDPTSKNAIEVAKLISLIANGSGTEYGANGGSTQTEKARNYMKSIGIYMDNSTSCTFQNMKASLDALRPVLLTGTARNIVGSRGYVSDGNHAWLADGYQIRQRSRSTRAILKQYNVYCHCNFGWGGNSDGWYLFASDGSITFDCNVSLWFGDYQVYDYNLKAYPNVRKG